MTEVSHRAEERGPQRVDPRDRAQLAAAPVRAGRVIELFAAFKWRLLLVTVTIVAVSFISLAQPFLIRLIIDDALPRQDTRLLGLAVGAMVGVAVVAGVLGVAQTWLATAMGQEVMHALRTRVFAHLQRQSLEFFKRTRTGEVHSRLTNDIAGLQSVVTNTATSVASHLTTAVATGAAMAVLNWRLALLSLLVLPPAIWTTRRVGLVRRDITAQRQQALADLHGQVEESLSVSGALLDKTLGLADRRLQGFSARSQELVDLEIRSQLAGRWRMATLQLVFAILPALVYLAAGFPQVLGPISIGTVIAFTTLQAAIIRPILGLLNIGAQWVASMALLSRIFGYLDLPIEVAPPRDPVPLDPADVRGDVRFRAVGFRYPDAEVDVLRGVDLTIPAGTSVGVVGETGAGKSTLVSLLLRLADPTSGAVSIDGVDLRRLDPSTVTGVVGMVTQETYLVHDTIRVNLLLARPDATEADLWSALAGAQVADVVRELPEGLDTVVGSRGHRFSGGERQRLAIARTLLRDPRILILDEATSALDNETERELQAALEEVRRGRTTITIAHRLTTVADADRIVVLDRGRVVESGTHEQLLRAGGRYAQAAT